ncbi:RHS repeat-associated core domain-containing protein [Aquimarina sp. 2201CG1-2-11]|uniref:RHS repeat domain-containing protein n=1 Tax=Aquimarina discodermiae TaxID=3231043 RepID=UPI003461ADDF
MPAEKGCRNYFFCSSYAVNGNLTIDRNKGITSILYNHMNLPTTVTVAGANNGTINYVYDATGAKLKKVTTESGNATTTEYAGGYIYKNGNLEYFSTAEGYVTPENGEYKYVYQFKDHLGNVRLSYTDADNNGAVEQSEIIKESNYYPFGLKMRGFNEIVSSHGNSTAQLRGFGGKEEQNEFGLGWIDIDARNYNPELGRWMNIDQKAELFYDWTPYKYGMNNPILLSDPDGNCEFCKKVLKSAVNAYKKTLSNTYEGAKKLVSSPIQTVKKAASNHFSKLSSPQGLVSLAKEASSVATAGMTDVAHDVIETQLYLKTQPLQ